MPKSIGPKFPIIVTSYEIALTDAKKHLRHYPWKYLVVDEVSVSTRQYVGQAATREKYSFPLPNKEYSPKGGHMHFNVYCYTTSSPTISVLFVFIEITRTARETFLLYARKHLGDLAIAQSSNILS